MGGKVLGTSDEGLLRKIQSLENEGLKIRLKVVLALTEKNKGLFDVQRFSSVPLELMPRLFELIQQKVSRHASTIMPITNLTCVISDWVSRLWKRDSFKGRWKIQELHSQPVYQLVQSHY